MRFIISVSIIAFTTFLSTNAVQAADNNPGTGLYAGIGFGASSLDVNSKPSRSSKEVDNGVLKIYGGYQFTEIFGIEGGYLRTGHVKVTDTVDGVDVTRNAKTRAAYLVGTGRLPLSDAFSVTGRLGMSYGDVNEGDVAPIPHTVYGSKASVMAGIGAQYNLSQRTSLSLDLDHVGKESKQVSADALTLTLRRSF